MEELKLKIQKTDVNIPVADSGDVQIIFDKRVGKENIYVDEGGVRTSVANFSTTDNVVAASVKNQNTEEPPLKFYTCSQQEYDEMETPRPSDTIYIIKPEEE